MLNLSNCIAMPLYSWEQLITCGGGGGLEEDWPWNVSFFTKNSMWYMGDFFASHRNMLTQNQYVYLHAGVIILCVQEGSCGNSTCMCCVLPNNNDGIWRCWIAWCQILFIAPNNLGIMIHCMHGCRAVSRRNPWPVARGRPEPVSPRRAWSP